MRCLSAIKIRYVIPGFHIQVLHTMLSFLAIMGSSAIDMIFITRLGESSLVAVSIVNPFIWFLNTITMGIGLAASVFISKLSKKDKGGFIGIAISTFLFSLLVYLIINIIYKFSGSYVVSLFSSDETTRNMAIEYLNKWVYFYIAFISFSILTASLRGRDLFKHQAIIILFCSALYIVLDPIFIYGLGGFSGYGLFGSIYSFCISQLVGIALCLVVIIKLNIIELSVLKKELIFIYFKEIKGISKLAMIASATAAFWPISVGLSTYLTSKLGSAEIATMGIISRLQPFMMIPVWGVSAVATVYISRFNTSKDKLGLKKAYYTSYLLVIFWQIIVAIPFLFFPHQMASFLLGDYLEPLNYVVLYFILIPITVFGRGMGYVTVSGLTAMNKANFAMLIDFVYVIIGHTSCYFIGFYYKNFDLALYSLLAFNLLGAIYSLIIFKNDFNNSSSSVFCQ